MPSLERARRIGRAAKTHGQEAGRFAVTKGKQAGHFAVDKGKQVGHNAVDAGKKTGQVVIHSTEKALPYVLVAAAVTAGAVIVEKNLPNNDSHPSTSPAITGTPRPTDAAGTPALVSIESAQPTAPESPLKAKLETNVQLPANWPMTREAVVTALTAAIPQSEQANLPKDFADMIRPDLKSDGTWTGQWIGEADTLQKDVTWDATQQAYVKDGKILTSDSDIYQYKTPDGKEWETPQWLPGVFLPAGVKDAYLFARTGGAIPQGADKNLANTSYYIGTDGAGVTAPIEQFALIPAVECDNPASAAWHDAVGNFVWNQDAQKDRKNGGINIEWYNPETKQMEVLDGRTITSLTKVMKQDALFTFIEQLPMGVPLTPQEAASALGNPDIANRIYLDTKTAQWIYEGFGLNKQTGAWFDATGGVFRNARGDVLTDPSKIFNFQDWESYVKTWPMHLNINVANSRVYVGQVNHGNGIRYAFYTVGNGVKLDLENNGAEQIAILMLQSPANVCVADPLALLAKYSADDAQHQADTTTDRVFDFRDGNWVSVTPSVKATATASN